MIVSITREYRWEMGHALMHHKGKCHNPHGHNYRMEVEVSGGIDPKIGMVMDFADLDVLVKPFIDIYDHAFLVNEADLGRLDPPEFVPVPDEPTAENIARWLWEDLRKMNGLSKLPHLSGHYNLERVTLWETDKASATIRRT